jgi:sterol desaturase/sphingolipid hydroxylase (fatty acid hydroxylase superfamily)
MFGITTNQIKTQVTERAQQFRESWKNAADTKQKLLLALLALVVISFTLAIVLAPFVLLGLLILWLLELIIEIAIFIIAGAVIGFFLWKVFGKQIKGFFRK